MKIGHTYDKLLTLVFWSNYSFTYQKYTIVIFGINESISVDLHNKKFQQVDIFNGGSSVL